MFCIIELAGEVEEIWEFETFGDAEAEFVQRFWFYDFNPENRPRSMQLWERDKLVDEYLPCRES